MNEVFILKDIYNDNIIDVFSTAESAERQIEINLELDFQEFQNTINHCKVVRYSVKD